MKYTFLFGLFLALMACIGTFAGCVLTSAMTGQTPVEIVTRWHEEDTVKDSEAKKSPDKDAADNAGAVKSDTDPNSQTEPPDVKDEPGETDDTDSRAASIDSNVSAKPPVPESTAQSLESVAAVVELAISQGYENYDVSYDEAGITAKVWYDGVAIELASIQESGGGADEPAWVAAKNSTIEMAKSLRGIMDDMGQNDALLVIHVLNDLNQESVLLSLINTDIVYDVLAE